jgi:hypothetical protein
MYGTPSHLQMTRQLVQRLWLGLNTSNLGVIARLLLNHVAKAHLIRPQTTHRWTRRAATRRVRCLCILRLH